MNFSSIKNIIFDLGAVIINIDLSLTFDAFARLGGIDLETSAERFKARRIFERYETGQLTELQLRDLLRDTFNPALSDSRIDEAWNALLLDMPVKRIERIRELRAKYKLFLLSNTNFIHIQKVNEILYQSAGVKTLDDLFDTAYYSYKIGMIKPHAEIYEYVLNKEEIKPEETLFLDDNAYNIEGAKSVGIQTMHVLAPVTMLDLLKNA